MSRIHQFQLTYTTDPITKKPTQKLVLLAVFPSIKVASATTKVTSTKISKSLKGFESDNPYIWSCYPLAD